MADAAELAGLPAMVLERAPEAAQTAGQTGWRFRLDAPNYQAVLTHCDREPRALFQRAWATRASDQGPPARGGTTAAHGPDPRAAARSRGARRLRELRRVLARHEDGRDPWRRSSSCSGSPAEPPGGRARIQELEALRAARSPPGTLPIYSEELKRGGTRVSDEELRPYFPLPRCSRDCSRSPRGCTGSGSRRAATCAA